MHSSDEPILRAEGLTKHYTSRDGLLDTVLGRTRTVEAVTDVDLELYPGETLGIVGESGCGKTTLGQTLLRLVEPTEGAVYYNRRTDGADRDRRTDDESRDRRTDGADWNRRTDDESRDRRTEIELTALSDRRLRELRTDLQYVFQDPFSSLNPRLTVGDIVGEPLEIHDIADGAERTERVAELLETVGLEPSHRHRFPHEFSGGQRQRIGIARALAVDPEIIVCDEPVSALDVSVQAQILNLLADLQETFDLSYVFIAHDLSVVEHVSDRIAVMYLGEFVETGTTAEVFAPPHHPYTEALLSAIPEPDPRWDGDRILLEGDVPSPVDPPSGCSFHTRCPRVVPPADLDLEQASWRALLDFKLRLRDADDRADLVTLSRASGADGTAVETLSRNRLDSLVRDEFDIPTALSDPTAESLFAEAIGELHEEGIDACERALEGAFTSPCETTVPPDVEQSPTHEIACLLYDRDGADAQEIGQSADERDGSGTLE